MAYWLATSAANAHQSGVRSLANFLHLTYAKISEILELEKAVTTETILNQLKA